VWAEKIHLLPKNQAMFQDIEWMSRRHKSYFGVFSPERFEIILTLKSVRQT
jgi:hypothetical protein